MPDAAMKQLDLQIHTFHFPMAFSRRAITDVIAKFLTFCIVKLAMRSDKINQMGSGKY